MASALSVRHQLLHLEVDVDQGTIHVRSAAGLLAAGC